MEMNENREQYTEKYFSDRLLRREAGEGWHPAGLNEEILDAIADREALLDQIVTAGGELHASEELVNQWRHQVEAVVRLKEEKGLGDPEPLLDEDG